MANLQRACRTCSWSLRVLLLNAALILLSSGAVTAGSTTKSGRGMCNLPPESSDELATSAKQSITQASKAMLHFPVTIANGSNFQMAAHIYTAQLTEGTENEEDATNDLCSHRQDIALVLLHGATYNSLYWDAEPIDGHSYSFARHFAELCYTVIALDELGAGQSDHPDGFTLNIEDHVLSTNQVLASLREDGNPFRQQAFKHVVLIGHSFGAILARSVLAAAPDAADILINTAASLGHEPSLPELGFLLAAIPGAYLTLPFEGPRGNMRKIFLYNGTVAPAMVDYDREKLVDSLPRATFIQLGELFAYRRSPDSQDVAKVIQTYRSDRIKIPIFHQCGDRDLFSKVETCLQAPDFFPNAPEVVTDLLADMGHSFNLHTNNLQGWTNIAQYIADKYPLESCTTHMMHQQLRSEEL